jgi:processive 1,2-diacylglycerol beta-glucosyltransferase/1,2-diacylglycerol 3-beta-galactosyltransferase
MNKKFLFFYLKTGGGHLAPAKSIEQYLEKKYKRSVVVTLADGLEKGLRFAHIGLESTYRFTQYQAKWFFELSYAINKIIPFAALSIWFVNLFIEYHLKHKIFSEKPDRIVVFHFFLIRSVLNTLKKNNIDIRPLVVVTDPYTAPPLWFMHRNRVDYIVFSDEVRDFAISRKIDPENIHVFPFVLDEKFSEQIDLREIKPLKEKLGFDKNKKIVLIMGGGDGIPKGKQILKKILLSKPVAQIAVVCGRNKKLFRWANIYKKRYNAENLVIYTFIDFVYELLNVSDLVITKCGASTFMEILFAGKIPVINSFIWEQEKGNVEFVERNELGIYQPDVNRLPEIISRLINDEKLYSFYIDNIKKAELINGAKAVSEFIYRY